MPENSWIGCQEYVETSPVALGLDCPSPTASPRKEEISGLPLVARCHPHSVSSGLS